MFTFWWKKWKKHFSLKVAENEDWQCNLTHFWQMLQRHFLKKKVNTLWIRLIADFLWNLYWTHFSHQANYPLWHIVSGATLAQASTWLHMHSIYCVQFNIQVMTNTGNRFWFATWLVSDNEKIKDLENFVSLLSFSSKKVVSEPFTILTVLWKKY